MCIHYFGGQLISADFSSKSTIVNWQSDGFSSENQISKPRLKGFRSNEMGQYLRGLLLLWCFETL